MTHKSGQTSKIGKKLHGGLSMTMHSPLTSTGEGIVWLRIAFVSKLSVWGQVRRCGVPTCLRSRLCKRARSTSDRTGVEAWKRWKGVSACNRKSNRHMT